MKHPDPRSHLVLVDIFTVETLWTTFRSNPFISSNMETEILTPDQVVAFQRLFISFYEEVKTGAYDGDRMEHWCEVVQEPRAWTTIQQVAPELIMDESMINTIQNQGIRRLLRSVKKAGLLEPAVSRPPLDTVQQTEFERLQDYLYLLFPIEVHREIHHFIDELYQVNTLYPPSWFNDGSDEYLYSGYGTPKPEDGRRPFDAHDAAFCDRIFNTMVRSYRLYMPTENTQAFDRFTYAYKKWRGRQTL